MKLNFSNIPLVQKHPLHDLLKEEQLIIEALSLENLLKPIQMQIINGIAYPIKTELTEYEKSLHAQLDYIADKKAKYEIRNRITKRV